MPRSLLRLLVIVFLMAFAARVGAQEQRVLLTSAVDELQTHAWAVYRNANDEILLVHVPPRDAGNSGAIKTDAALPGSLQAFRPLGHKFPLALAAIDDRVYMIFPKAYSQSRQIMRVYSGSAVPSPVGAMWTFSPVDRLDAEPPIETQGSLLDFIATSRGVYALINESDRLRLLALRDTRWDAVPLPPGARDDAHDWSLAAVGDQLLLIDRAADQLSPLSLSPDAQSWDPTQWAPMPKPRGPFAVLSGERGMTLVSWDEQDHATLSVWNRSGVFTIAAGLTIPRDAKYALLDSVSELLGIEGLAGSVDKASPSPTVALWELDMADGSTIYQGPPVAQTPVSVGEFRFLVGMMVMIMVGVLVVVIMPDRPDAMQVPDGFALADPGRRLLATMVDVGLVALLMGRVFNVNASEIITLGIIVRADNAWVVIPTTMLSGVVIMTVFERVLGATPGKLLMGIRVVRASTGPMQRPSLWAALVRNVIKWILPPVAALALVDPESLHRGDRATRTIVAIPLRSVIPPPGEDPDQS